MPSGSDDMVRYRKCLERASKYFGGNMKRAGVWLNTSHADLGDRTPISVLTAGDYERVEAALNALESTPRPEPETPNRKPGILRNVRSITDRRN